MLTVKIPNQRMEYVIDSLEVYFGSAVLQRGWEYFHKGLVTELDLRETTLHAQVRGSASSKRAHTIKMDFVQFVHSSCSCSLQGWCHHLAATAFALYAPHGRPELLLNQLLREQQQSKSRSVRATNKLEKARETALAPLEIELPHEWQKFYEQQFRGYVLNNQHSVESFQLAALETLLPYSADWEPNISTLYHFHVLWFTLRKLDEFHQARSSYYLSYYHVNTARTTAVTVWKLIVDTLPAIDASALRSKYPRHWKKTIEITGAAILQPSDGPVDWMDIYRYLWHHFFTDRSEAARELKRLQQLFDSASSAPEESKPVTDHLLTALGYFDIMQGNDEQARARLSELEKRQVHDFYPMLREMEQAGEGERLLSWLRWLNPAMAEAKQDDFHRMCSLWTEAMRYQDNDAEWIQLMLSLLPRSNAYYTDYLIRTERYHAWVDLQLSGGGAVSDLYPPLLKDVESHEPALLLPLYHQGVEQAIEEKSRVSYQDAVRLLKKLHQLYGKLNKLKLWDDYIHRLSTKYSRLRAFQEELQKGKWMS